MLPEAHTRRRSRNGSAPESNLKINFVLAREGLEKLPVAPVLVANCNSAGRQHINSLQYRRRIQRRNLVQVASN